MTPQQKGSLGGAVTAADSPRKARALRALHAARRGVRMNPDTRERRTILAAVAAAIRTPVRGVRSLRVVAAFCRVDARTVTRWLRGEDYPPAAQLRRLEQWLRQLGSDHRA